MSETAVPTIEGWAKDAYQLLARVHRDWSELPGAEQDDDFLAVRVLLTEASLLFPDDDFVEEAPSPVSEHMQGLDRGEAAGADPVRDLAGDEDLHGALALAIRLARVLLENVGRVPDMAFTNEAVGLLSDLDELVPAEVRARADEHVERWEELAAF